MAQKHDLALPLALQLEEQRRVSMEWNEREAKNKRQKPEREEGGKGEWRGREGEGRRRRGYMRAPFSMTEGPAAEAEALKLEFGEV